MCLIPLPLFQVCSAALGALNCDVTSHIFPLYLSVEKLPLIDVLRTGSRSHTFDPAMVLVILTNTPGAVAPFVHLIVKIRVMLPVLLSCQLGIAANSPWLPIAIPPPADYYIVIIYRRSTSENQHLA